MSQKYNSGINIMGSIPDYSSMIEYIIEEHKGVAGNGSFQFRTNKSLKRFIAGIEESVLLFKDAKHKKLFFDGLTSTELSTNDKFMLIFWQMVYANALFHNIPGATDIYVFYVDVNENNHTSDITAEVFMKAVYQGRNILSQDDVYGYIKHLKEKHPEELNWSEATLKIIASKYLTAIKKLGLADGTMRKEIRYPLIGNVLFVYFIRWCQCVCPENKTICNEFVKFGFCDNMTLISKLKKIDFMQYWDITQVTDEVTIDLKAYE